MTSYADASDIAIWGWKGWAIFALAFAIAAVIGWRIEAHHRPTATDTPELHYGGCNDIRPHAMLPTAYGWKCANDCGESWYVEDSDALAAADLALWEIENDWEVEA